jgi:hypothetical protein
VIMNQEKSDAEKLAEDAPRIISGDTTERAN